MFFADPLGSSFWFLPENNKGNKVYWSLVPSLCLGCCCNMHLTSEMPLCLRLVCDHK